MSEFETEIKEVIQRNYNVKSFRFSVKEKVNFLAGQFFFVTIKTEGKDTTKHFSFSNSPTEEGYVEFTKKITTSEFSRALDKLKVGDWARVRLAYGQFTPFEVLPNGEVATFARLLQTGFTWQGEYPRIAFISGGIGITPVRSICKFATDKRLPIKITLLYSNNTPEDIIFKEDFEEMQVANKNLKVVYTITLPDQSRRWPGRTGRIDEKMVSEEIPDYAERIFYTCGPPGMVEAIKEMLSFELNIDSKKIKTESFTGYK